MYAIRSYYEDSNFIRSLEPLAKRVWRAESASQLPRILQRGFNQMLTGRKGPVVVALPMNVQAEAVEVNEITSGRRHANALPAGDENAVRDAVKLLREAERPVLLP